MSRLTRLHTRQTRLNMLMRRFAVLLIANVFRLSCYHWRTPNDGGADFERCTFRFGSTTWKVHRLRFIYLFIFWFFYRFVNFRCRHSTILFASSCSTTHPSYRVHRLNCSINRIPDRPIFRNTIYSFPSVFWKKQKNIRAQKETNYF